MGWLQWCEYMVSGIVGVVGAGFVDEGYGEKMLFRMVTMLDASYSCDGVMVVHCTVVNEYS